MAHTMSHGPQAHTASHIETLRYILASGQVVGLLKVYLGRSPYCTQSQLRHELHIQLHHS